MRTTTPRSVPPNEAWYASTRVSSRWARRISTRRSGPSGGSRSRPSGSTRDRSRTPSTRPSSTLPAQWEYAARGGLEGAPFTWGTEDTQDSFPKANSWQGRFPYENTAVDGWIRTAPVGSFEPNGYGLFDMAGNVWEWTDDWYRASHADPAAPSCCIPADPRGGTAEASLDPLQPFTPIPRKVLKGGSHLCAPSYCLRYRPAARQPQMIDTGMSHVGFRTIIDVRELPA